jgi:hypothetical protein
MIFHHAIQQRHQRRNAACGCGLLVFLSCLDEIHQPTCELPLCPSACATRGACPQRSGVASPIAAREASREGGSSVGRTSLRNSRHISNSLFFYLYFVSFLFFRGGDAPRSARTGVALTRDWHESKHGMNPHRGVRSVRFQRPRPKSAGRATAPPLALLHCVLSG